MLAESSLHLFFGHIEMNAYCLDKALVQFSTGFGINGRDLFAHLTNPFDQFLAVPFRKALALEKLDQAGTQTMRCIQHVALDFLSLRRQPAGQFIKFARELVIFPLLALDSFAQLVKARLNLASLCLAGFGGMDGDLH